MDEQQQEETLATFVSLTGSDMETAKFMLQASNWDIGQATNLFFDQGMSGGNSSSNSNFNPSNFQEEEVVRAPIQETVQRLTDDGGPPTGFNNFSGFNQNIPQEMMQNMMGFQQNSRNVFKPKSKMESNFDKIFAPPEDIMFDGTFEQARESAKIENKWILVNIQNPTEFDALKLNRDCWSNDIIKSIIEAFFVFWQQEDTTNEGKRFCSFYDVTTAPTIAIIDPRTGECVKTWTGYIEKEKLIGYLQKFSETNQYTPIEEKPLTFETNSFQPKPQENISHDEMDEDEMMRLAIEASLQTYQAPEDKETSKDEVLEVEDKVMEEPKIEEKREYIKDFNQYITKENSTRLQLRFESGKREVINLSLKAPLSAIYAIYHDKLSDEEKDKKFDVIFMNEHLENTNEISLEDKNIKNASLSILFDE